MWPNLKSGPTNGLIDASARVQNNLTSRASDDLKSTHLLITNTLILRLLTNWGDRNVHQNFAWSSPISRCSNQGSAKKSQSQVIPSRIPIPKFWKIDPNPNPKNLGLGLGSHGIGISVPTPGSNRWYVINNLKIKNWFSRKYLKKSYFQLRSPPLLVRFWFFKFLVD